LGPSQKTLGPAWGPKLVADLTETQSRMLYFALEKGVKVNEESSCRKESSITGPTIWT